MNRKTTIILLVIVVAIASAVWYVYHEYNRPAGTIGSVDFTMESSQLLGEFEQNEEASNKKYLDKVIEVKGPVKDVMHQDNLVTILLGDKDAMSSVSCSFGKEGSSAAEGIKPGDTVTIKGMCTGILLDVALVNCEIVK